MSKEKASPNNNPVVPPPRLDESQVIGCEYLHYPWDDWHRWSLAQGLNERLAGAGRLLVREAYQHDWDASLKKLCGWSDDGQALLDYALRFPQAACRRWDILMRTDGLRGDYKPRTVEWTWGYLKADARRLAAQDDLPPKSKPTVKLRKVYHQAGQLPNEAQNKVAEVVEALVEKHKKAS